MMIFLGAVESLEAFQSLFFVLLAYGGASQQSRKLTLAFFFFSSEVT